MNSSELDEADELDEHKMNWLNSNKDSEKYI